MNWQEQYFKSKSQIFARKRKEQQQEKKAQKAAKIAAADELARTIFQKQKPDICAGCIELRSSLETVELERKDALAALEAKKVSYQRS